MSAASEEVSFEPSSPSGFSLYSAWSSTYASSSSRTSSVSTHSATRSPSNSEYCLSKDDGSDLIGPSPQTFSATAIATRSGPAVSPSTISSSHSAATYPSAGNIPDLTLAPSVLPFTTSETRPHSVSRAPSTSSTTSAEFDDDEECPPNFALVAPGLYRSSFPKSNHFAYLKTLGLKSVLFVFLLKQVYDNY